MLSTIMPCFILYIAEHGDTNLGGSPKRIGDRLNATELRGVHTVFIYSLK